MSAWDDLVEYLNEGEVIESVSFGPWGWDGFGEPEDKPVPKEKQGVPMPPSEAQPLMQSWSFYGGYGSPDCYAVNVWTNSRVIWVTQYDGATGLDSAPRNPSENVPDMPGG